LSRLARTDRYGTTLAGLERAAKAEGLHAEGVQMDLNALKRMEGGGLSWVDGDHFVALLSVSGEDARIRDPNHAEEETIPTEALLRRSGGIVLKISRP
jgi:ABC-type bacteriocin/lantibiotic exporter with double-glycine peptidase domain